MCWCKARSRMMGFFTTERIKGIIAIIAAIVMYFTPDEIDKIIEILLGMFGISTFAITHKDDGEDKYNNTIKTLR